MPRSHNMIYGFYWLPPQPCAGPRSGQPVPRLQPRHESLRAEGAHGGGLGRARENAGLHRRLGDSIRPRGGARSRSPRRVRPLRRIGTAAVAHPWQSLPLRPNTQLKPTKKARAAEEKAEDNPSLPTACLPACLPLYEPAVSDRGSDDPWSGGDRGRGLYAGAAHLHGRTPDAGRSRSQFRRHFHRALGWEHTSGGNGRIRGCASRPFFSHTAKR